MGEQLVPVNATSLQPLQHAFLVDDDGVSRRLVAHLLRRNGVVSQQAGDGVTVLTMLSYGSRVSESDALGGARQTGQFGSGVNASRQDSSGATSSPAVTVEPAAQATALRIADAQVWLIDHMPGMNGPELAKELRRAGIRAPIIGVTGDEGAFPGADAVVCKPLTIGALEDALASVGLRFAGRSS